MRFPAFQFAALLALAVPATAADPVVSAQARQEADGSHTLVHEILVPAAPALVWAAISTPEGWTGWAVPVAWHPPGEPDTIETSYAPAAGPNDPSTIRQQILVRIPGRMLAFRTVKAPQGFPDFDTYGKVTSIFELMPAGGGATLVRLTGVGYADTDAGRRLLAFFTRGNAASLEWLKARFVDGPPDWPKRLAPPPR